jgi:hypothetical protein
MKSKIAKAKLDVEISSASEDEDTELKKQNLKKDGAIT